MPAEVAFGHPFATWLTSLMGSRVLPHNALALPARPATFSLSCDRCGVTIECSSSTRRVASQGTGLSTH